MQSTLASAKEIIPLIFKHISPSSVLDIGCGLGAWLKIWKEAGVGKILGIDGKHININDLLIEKEEFRYLNLNNSFSIESKFDLVTCLEVAEHLRPESSKLFIDSLCKGSDIILFSAAIPGQEGTLHLNEQYPNYWINLFSENNFEVYDILRNEIWDNNLISFWYRQNILFFINKNIKSQFPSVTNEFKKANAIVHPILLEHKERRIKEYSSVLKNPFTANYYFIRRYFKKIISFFKK